MAEDDLYQELGCSPTATPQELRSAYKQLVRQFHPDLHPNDPSKSARFHRITAAYDVLSDEKKRRQYDLHGKVAIRAGFDPDRVRAAAAAAAMPLPPLHVAVAFVEAARGASKVVELDAERQQRHGLPPRVEVRVPPGLESGHILQIAPRPPAREPLMLKLVVAPHPLFRRQGMDVVYELPITLPEALRGHSLHIPTPRGAVPFDVPPGVETGAEFCVRGHGVGAPIGKPAGDLRIKVRVVMPVVPPDADGDALMNGLAECYDGPVRTGWFRTADLPRVDDDEDDDPLATVS